MSIVSRTPFALRWLSFGLLLLAVTLGFVSLWFAAFGQPVEGWDWTVVTFVLVIVETLLVGGLAAANGPYEARLRRWGSRDFNEDAYATQFRLDLAAQEQNAPRRLFVDSRFIIMAVPVAIATFALGIALGQPDENEPITIIQAMSIADEAIRPMSSRSAIPGWPDVTQMTMEEALETLPVHVPISRSNLSDGERQVFLVSYSLGDKTQDNPTERPGPQVLVDAMNGVVLLVVEAP